MADVPHIDFEVAKQIAINLHNTIQAFGDEMHIPRSVTDKVGATLGGLVFVPALLLILGLQAALALGTWFGEAVLETIDTAKDSNRGQLNELLATTINELLGTQISGSDLATGGSGGNTFDATRGIGAALLSQFEQGFSANTEITPQTGADNARKFLGFGVNFATTQGFFSIIAEASTLGYLKEFHELPDGLAQAIGLSRLQRQALAPLVRNCVAQPYDLYLKRILRPDRLTESQLVQAMRAGTLDESVVRDELAQKGYRDQDIEILIAQHSAKLSTSELFNLLVNGDIEESDALDRIKATGVDDDTAKLILKAAQLSRAQGQVSGILSDLENAYLGAFIDEATFNSILGNLPLGDLQEQLYRTKVGVQLERARKRVSWSELKNAWVLGHTDLEYVDLWLAAEGYDDESKLILVMELSDAAAAADKKQKAAAAAATKKAQKGQSAPPSVQNAANGTPGTPATP